MSMKQFEKNATAVGRDSKSWAMVKKSYPKKSYKQRVQLSGLRPKKGGGSGNYDLLPSDGVKKFDKINIKNLTRIYLICI